MAWYNSNFAYIFHIGRRCGTPDEAYRVIEGCLENREMALREADHGRKKRDLKHRRLVSDIERLNKEQPEGYAFDVEEKTLELAELTMHLDVEETNYDITVREVAFIKHLLAELEPHCEFVGKVPDKQAAYQLAQRKEFFVKNLKTAHNQLLSQRGIDPALLEQIQIHPDAKLIGQMVNVMTNAAQSGLLTLDSITEFIPALPACLTATEVTPALALPPAREVNE